MREFIHNLANPFRRPFRLLFVSFCCALSLHNSSAGTAAPQKPNFLFAIADDWSGGHAGAYGCDWIRTPAFDRVAKQGLLFTRAYTPSSKCAPSRSCILTGRNPWQLGAACNHVPFFPPEFKTFPEALGEKGYWVGMTGKGWSPGVATNSSGQDRQMTGRAYQSRQAKPPATGISAIDYGANFEDFLNAAPEGKPWSFWYGGIEPHRAYEYGSGAAEGGKKLSDVGKVPGYWPDNEVVRNDMLDYAFEVEHFDRHLLRMLGSLEARGQLSNTVVIVTSDNAMPFPRGKGQSYEESTHMPLAIMWPAGIRNPGRVIKDYVSFVDFAPTILELAEVSQNRSGMHPMTGRSLSNIMRSKKSGQVDRSREFVLLGRERYDVGRPDDWGYPLRGIVLGDMLYLRNYEPTRWPSGNPETGYLDCDGSPTKSEVLKEHRREAGDTLKGGHQAPNTLKGGHRTEDTLKGEHRTHWQLCFGLRPGEELYDLGADPACLTNLAGRSEKARLQRKMSVKLEQELRAQGDLRMFGQGSQYEQFPYADERTRNFYNRLKAGEKPRAGWVNESDFD